VVASNDFVICYVVVQIRVSVIDILDSQCFLPTRAKACLVTNLVPRYMEIDGELSFISAIFIKYDDRESSFLKANVEGECKSIGNAN
jgi:hypothetical protein